MWIVLIAVGLAAAVRAGLALAEVVRSIPSSNADFDFA